MSKPVPNFVVLDSRLPRTRRVVEMMLGLYVQAGRGVPPGEPVDDNWWDAVLSDSRAYRRKKKPYPEPTYPELTAGVMRKRGARDLAYHCQACGANGVFNCDHLADHVEVKRAYPSWNTPCPTCSDARRLDIHPAWPPREPAPEQRGGPFGQEPGQPLKRDGGA